MNRCYLCADGVAVTDRFGRIGGSVAWSEVTGVRPRAVASLVMACHGVELLRDDAAAPL
ncbi:MULTISPECIES: hypothetical protein [Streptomyces]|uniref:Uncharacterized protein n=1 Tax=Streptomyces changanensis TaxID=2964669 RepID=A0ABY5N3R0_9ACTN|nr:MULTISPECIES: hypothetical protein [Streptomyces]UUS31170.1 hypothetical protein NRO40_10175 [Streptomyces changanensis]